ncbi:NUDIX domain-containing protein [Haloferax mediterranei ATCC 33500]|uniref:NUDIX domain-containing protein n=1 Tax=Haloferax mediterranei (strain ATCC 33500 / DSM 1411 / JCM 8866 / NBRC 14739 / NCIMB 2177 / R-4) TaxID=523841 RepID=I3R658_HALMT|nr:NUDIX domain-containing protein [Haloferax mediterranei]AFK19718.1 translation initiation factor IF-2B alpha subunit [Haloferax mediterranei ATCC 33500]AHZ23106.1 translation initiation factor 2 [Haloferax mediterranei ATCC 33500]EMA00040.1 translation initiation factor IF-2 [Haloferax mediterranei ATCC 33500]MDX5987537.1 NUDIX domain-containing protein [Haloferax mediterranei ATCC 33500]QCQ74034.1 NUDIX domain-containing protein [Haloferax mediterranei ATCC 33500]
MTHVATAFLRHGGRVLLTRRSDEVGTYQGRWAGVSGYVEGDPENTEVDARRELREEVGVTDAELVRSGQPLSITDDGREWTVHPFLFDVADRTVDPNEELAEVEWVHPTEIPNRETVPGLWSTYRRVAPTVETVRDDETHGSAWISIRALEVLRDTAVEAESRDDLVSLARELRDARPSMTAVGNRVNRVMADADRSPEGIRRRTEAEIDSAVVADETAAAEAAQLLRKRDFDRVATLSRSGTVVAALKDAQPSVVVAESRPGLEGVTVVETLARAGIETTLTTDAALPNLVASGEVDCVLVGADSVLASGAVVNKVGSYPVALAADRGGVPFFTVCARDKIRSDDEFVGEDDGSLYDGEESVKTENPLFEVVPEEFVAGVVTEDGVLDAEGVSKVTVEHAELEAWDDQDDDTGR